MAKNTISEGVPRASKPPVIWKLTKLFICSITQSQTQLSMVGHIVNSNTMPEIPRVSSDRSLSGYALFSVPTIVWVLSAAVIILHVAFARQYGYFRDELYYIVCSEHLDWGYVDQPPLIAALTWLARHLLGSGLIAMRLLPALASGATVWMTAKFVRELKGGLFAQGIAALAVVLAPVYLVLWHWITMNAFEPLLWTTCAWFALRAMSSGNGKWWLWFGVVVGIGMENKYSMAFFGAALWGALLLTRERRWVISRWLWLGAAIALVVFLPNLIWLYRHGFPFLELMRNVRLTGRDVVRWPH
jgi:hypothetical protein